MASVGPLGAVAGPHVDFAEGAARAKKSKCPTRAQVPRGPGAVLSGCTFIDNQTTVGGGVAIRGSQVTITVTDCTFTDNTAWNTGVTLFQSCHLTMTGCLFSDNASQYGPGGALYLTGNTNTNRGRVHTK